MKIRQRYRHIRLSECVASLLGTVLCFIAIVPALLLRITERESDASIDHRGPDDSDGERQLGIVGDGSFFKRRDIIGLDRRQDEYRRIGA